GLVTDCAGLCFDLMSVLAGAGVGGLPARPGAPGVGNGRPARMSVWRRLSMPVTCRPRICALKAARSRASRPADQALVRVGGGAGPPAEQHTLGTASTVPVNPG